MEANTTSQKRGSLDQGSSNGGERSSQILYVFQKLEPPGFHNRLDIGVNERKEGSKDDFKGVGLSNQKGRTATTEMSMGQVWQERSKHFVFDLLSRRCVSHIQVQLLSSPELRGDMQAGDRHSGAVSLPTRKVRSLDELTKGRTEKKRSPVTRAKA